MSPFPARPARALPARTARRPAPAAVLTALLLTACTSAPDDPPDAVVGESGFAVRVGAIEVSGPSGVAAAGAPVRVEGRPAQDAAQALPEFGTAD